MYERISISLEICGGQPCIRGTRVPVALIVGMIGGGDSIETLLKAYPHITREDILACLNYAADLVGQVRVFRAGEGEKAVLPTNLINGVIKPPLRSHRRSRSRSRRVQRYVTEETRAA